MTPHRIPEPAARCSFEWAAARRRACAAWESTSGGVVVERFGPKADDLAEIEGVLCDHGICSSAPVRPVLEGIRRQRSLHDGDPVIFMALGPGLTLYAALLHARRPETPRSG